MARCRDICRALPAQAQPLPKCNSNGERSRRAGDPPIARFGRSFGGWAAPNASCRIRRNAGPGASSRQPNPGRRHQRAARRSFPTEAAWRVTTSDHPGLASCRWRAVHAAPICRTVPVRLPPATKRHRRTIQVSTQAQFKLTLPENRSERRGCRRRWPAVPHCPTRGIGIPAGSAACAEPATPPRLEATPPRERLSVALSQPLRVQHGRASLTLPVARTTSGRVAHTSVAARLAPEARQTDLAVTWEKPLAGGPLRPGFI